MAIIKIYNLSNTVTADDFQ